MVSLWVLHALSPSEEALIEAHVTSCAVCQVELDALRPVVETFVAWPTDVLRSPRSLWGRLAERIANEPRDQATRDEASPPTIPAWVEPEWQAVAPGIQCKLLATEPERVSMLVRLAPGTHYPAHSHAGIEELHLLDGELWIEERKLYPGDYNRAEPGTSDKLVWSETGCTCLLITSPDDVLR